MEKSKVIGVLNAAQSKKLDELAKKMYDSGFNSDDIITLYKLTMYSWRVGYCEGLEMYGKGKNSELFEKIYSEVVKEVQP